MQGNYQDWQANLQWDQMITINVTVDRIKPDFLIFSSTKALRAAIFSASTRQMMSYTLYTE